MKKLVSIEDLSGWREPTALEEESIQLFKQGTLEAKIYYTFRLIVLTIVDISIVIFVIRHISSLSGQDVVALVALFIGILYVICKTYKNNAETSMWYKDIIGGYLVMKCSIHKLEYERNIKNLIGSCDILAYIHNTLEEYCNTPILVDNSIEDLVKSDIQDDFLLLKLNNHKYKILQNTGGAA